MYRKLLNQKYFNYVTKINKLYNNELRLFKKYYIFVH